MFTRKADNDPSAPPMTKKPRGLSPASSSSSSSSSSAAAAAAGGPSADELSATVMSHLSGAMGGIIVFAGSQLGLFDALAACGPATAANLATAVDLDPRYVLEWLNGAVAAGYAQYNVSKATEKELAAGVGGGSGTYFMNEAQIAAMANVSSPRYCRPFFDLVVGNIFLYNDVVAKGFKAGGGMPFSAYNLHSTIAQVNANTFANDLIPWMEAIPGLVDRLHTPGTRFLDIGCGEGQATLVLAKAFPDAIFVGLDADHASIINAREHAFQASLTNASFVEASLRDYPSILSEPTSRFGYDIVWAYDTLHDIGDLEPTLRAIRAVCRSPDTMFIWSEPSGSSNPNDNRHPRGVMRAGISLLHCLPVAIGQDGAGTGTVIGSPPVFATYAKRAGFLGVEELDVPDKTNYFFKVLLPPTLDELRDGVGGE
ncbi:methylase [Thecamonas trahens ATCC 50062]|uniref:Methylase n=1 Tax=Thecamonas trahens ATCC 50062 TaxID=461836 RepID=A0A0L0DNS7_THETB|nr:methylase [Thecamonas trahens ATCC 50062]KNC53920.1 methylase [Thecamonas trahens ATCC 50062]|eukprot:XP_013754125.1 methylase [Thecamonas trahens ATCC 50062]